MKINKFHCKQCGECCKNFGDGDTLPLFNREKKFYEELAVQTGVDIKFVPENILLDKKSGIMFCLNWGLKGNPCPFLIGNKCSIYNNRALICRAFPIHKIPDDIRSVNLGCFMTCINNDSKNIILSRKRFEEIYSLDSIYSRLEIDKRKRFMEDKLIFLQKNNMISLVKMKHCLGVNIFSFDDFILKFQNCFI